MQKNANNFVTLKTDHITCSPRDSFLSTH